MKRLIADIHMHTLASGHAYGTIREMAAAAKEQQLQLIGISEHAPGIPGTVDPFYYGNLRVIPRVIDGVEILHGCEINVLNGGRLSLEQKYIDRFMPLWASMGCATRTKALTATPRTLSSA